MAAAIVRESAPSMSCETTMSKAVEVWKEKDEKEEFIKYWVAEHDA